jgi:type III secretion protein J
VSRTGSILASGEDPGAEGKYRVLVASSNVPRALGALRAEELPRAKVPGVLEATAKGGLVPSESAERAQLVTGMGGELQRTLEGIDGVLTARVHLNVPPRDALRLEKKGLTTASVLVEYRGATPPIAEASIQKLVAGGVPDLQPADVAVTMLSRPAPPPAPPSSGSRSPLPATPGVVRALGAAVVVLLGLLAVAVTLLLRRRGVRSIS